ncbi:MAG: ELWxxDGT repeat protein [Bacteroidota bacterium]
MKTKFTLLAITLAFIGLSVNAQTPTILKDINPGINSSSPYYLTDVNGTLFYTANNGTNGIELWKSDGTAAGTVMVKDINSGSGNSTTASDYINVNGTLYFTANDGTSGMELWKSDGTAAGTVMVKDINPGSNGSSPIRLTNVNGTLFFMAGDGTNWDKLWKSDGTAAGTVMVSNININIMVSFEALNNIILFCANDGTNGQELWKSDGTAAGTVMLKDLNPGSADAFNTSGGVRKIFSYNGSAYFCAQYANNQWALWKTDGTTIGTIQVKTGISNVPGYIGINSDVYFVNVPSVAYDLWKTDGTTAGTVEIKQGCFPTAQTPYMAVLNNKLLFGGKDQTNGGELWTSDGTLTGTVMLKDINTGSSGSGPMNMTVSGNTLYFSAATNTQGWELWQSDGSNAGTVMVADIYPGTQAGVPFSADPSFLTVMNGDLYFSAKNGTNGTELWKLNGSTAGITSFASNDKINIFPNPSTGKFKIESNHKFSKNTVFEVYNSLGDKVLQQQNPKDIDLSNFSKGVYFVNITEDGQTFTKKIILE